MSLANVASSFLEDLKCSLCKSYKILPSYGNYIGCNCLNHSVKEQKALQRIPYNSCTESKKYLEFHKLKNHEEVCPYHLYECPSHKTEYCSWTGTISQICTHYKTQHPEFYVNSLEFKINFSLNCDLCYLLESEGIVLLIKISLKNDNYWFNVVYAGYNPRITEIKYRLKLSNIKSERSVELEEKPLLPMTSINGRTPESLHLNVDAFLYLLENPEYVKCQCTITEPASLSKYITIHQEIDTERIACSYCNYSMVPPIYRCPLGHSICMDCKEYNNNCRICHETKVSFARAIDLENISYSILHRCKWKTCNKIFSCLQIRMHEENCSERVYTCPECAISVGIFTALLKHFKHFHNSTCFEIVESNTVSCSLRALDIYTFVHREIFKVSICKDNNWEVYIVYYGPPCQQKQWQYEVRYHSNSLYYASNCVNNWYKVNLLTPGPYKNLHSENYVTIQFKKNNSKSIWIPFEHN